MNSISSSQDEHLDDLFAMVDSCGMLVMLGPADLHKLEDMGNDRMQGALWSSKWHIRIHKSRY